jgi:hypothetical protein
MMLKPEEYEGEAARLAEAFDRDNDAASPDMDIPDRIAAANMYANLAIAHQLRRIADMMAAKRHPSGGEGT